MTYYDWICNECECIWEQDHSIGTAPKQTECPECGELRSRNWSSVSNFRMLGDCHTNRVRLRDTYINGLDKDTAHDFYNEALKSSKEAQKTGWKQYAKYTPNIEQGVKDGLVRRRSIDEASKRRESAKKLSRIVYNQSGQDIAETLERKPQ